MPARRRDLCRPSTNHQKEDSLCTITPAPTAGRIWTRTNAVTASPASVGNPQSGTAWTACGRGGARGPAVSALKLGSLFDGIGVFPLAASRCGIVPVWASEIARAPVSITKRHFPEMLHLADRRRQNTARGCGHVRLAVPKSVADRQPYRSGRQ